MFSQLAKRSARFLPADLCTDHAHYVKNHKSTVLRRNKSMAVEGGTVSHYYILVIRNFLDFMSLFRHSVRFFLADKNRRRVELSSGVSLQTFGKLKSLQGTELSVVVVICLLGSFWINVGFKVFTDRNKRSEMLWSVDVYSVMICRAVSSYL